MTEHIKMPDIAPLVRYLANGTETEFVYPFPIFASEDLRVSLDGAPQLSGYTISGSGETEGGQVIFTTAPGNGVTVTLERRLQMCIRDSNSSFSWSCKRAIGNL